MTKQLFTLRGENETLALAGALAGQLKRGDVLLLFGGLGAGKTAFTRGLVAGLGGDIGQVSSPTFAILQIYQARLPVYHFDLYRLAGEDEVYDLGFDEYLLQGDGICVVEWPERAEDMLLALPHIRIDIAHVKDEIRTLSLEGDYAPINP